MKINIKSIIILSFFVIFVLGVANGQPFNPPDGGGTPLGDPVGAPIDGGISALIAAGGALVVRKFWKNRKAKKENL